MIRQVIARKLLMYVLYSAVVTALPVLAATPLASVVLPALQSPEPCVDGQCHAPQPLPTTVAPDRDVPAAVSLAPAPTPVVAPRPVRPWWCRGPIRRAIRGVACFVSRPWR